MRNVQLKSITNTILYEGTFPDFNACLEQAVAEKANLAAIDLRNLNLSNTNLDEAQMEGAHFNNSNLTGTNLSEANLKGANFSGSALYNACLCESDLSGCNFEDASFGATDIAGATLAGSLFSTLSSFHLDFSTVRDMQRCVFKNPCGQESAMSKPPVVIHGLLPAPIVLFDRHVKIGHALKSHEDWFSLVAARYLRERNFKLAG